MLSSSTPSGLIGLIGLIGLNSLVDLSGVDGLNGLIALIGLTCQYSEYCSEIPARRIWRRASLFSCLLVDVLMCPSTRAPITATEI